MPGGRTRYYGRGEWKNKFRDEGDHVLSWERATRVKAQPRVQDWVRESFTVPALVRPSVDSYPEAWLMRLGVEGTKYWSSQRERS
jgi:hypothetical protein